MDVCYEDLGGQEMVMKAITNEFKQMLGLKIYWCFCITGNTQHPENYVCTLFVPVQLGKWSRGRRANEAAVRPGCHADSLSSELEATCWQALLADMGRSACPQTGLLEEDWGNTPASFIHPKVGNIHLAMQDAGVSLYGNLVAMSWQNHHRWLHGYCKTEV